MAQQSVSLRTMKGYNQSGRPNLTASLPITLFIAGTACVVGTSLFIAANILPPSGGEFGGEAPAMESGANPSSAFAISNQCFLLISACPPDTPRCGREPMAVPILCTSPQCTPASCVKASEYRSSTAASSSGNTSTSYPLCIIKHSACSPNDPSCLSPISIEQITCSDIRCMTELCTPVATTSDAVPHIEMSTGTPTTEPPTTFLVQPPENNWGAGPVEQAPPAAALSGEMEMGIRQGPVLGCFAENGIWTTDRNICATDQIRFMQGQQIAPSAETVPETVHEVSLLIEEQFVPDTRRTALVQNLLSTTIEAAGRLALMLENPGLSPEMRMNLNETLEWLRAVQRTAAQGDQSMIDLQMLADAVSKRLVETRLSIVAWAESSGRPLQPTPLTLTDKMDRFLLAFPSIFAILQGELIALPPEAVTGYADAQSLYELIKPTCLDNPNTCGQLSQVIEKLEPVVASLKAAIDRSGRTDLEAQIDLMME